MPPRIEQRDRYVLLWIKAVPGASRSQVAGVLGDRLKVRIAAAPEHGKANAAICDLVAEKLKIKASRVTVESGHTSAEKIIRIAGLSAEDLRPLWE